MTNTPPLFDIDPPAGAILAATRWPTNGHLVADCFRLGYLTDADTVIDPTYGRGNWWTIRRPAALTASDINPKKSPTGSAVDFTALPWPADTFDAAAFDPPYKPSSGAKTGLVTFADAYGLDTLPGGRRSEPVQQLINDGLSEVARVVRPGGFILVKCMDYINARALWPGTFYTTDHGLNIGLRLHDRLEHVGDPGPASSTWKQQDHARRNASTLLVFRKPVRPTPNRWTSRPG